MATCADLQTRLIEAELALHRLLTGAQTQQVQYGEKRVAYTQASIAELQRYVSTLRSQVAACTGAPMARRRVIGIIPGG